MSEASNFQPLGRRNRKKLNLESIVAEAESLLASQAGNFQPRGKTNRKKLNLESGGAVASRLVRRLRIEWSGFKPWTGTLCCVLGQDTLLSPPRCINGYRRI